MPTDKPRVNVTLAQADYDLLSTLAKQQKRSRADMLRDLFETMRPVLERVAVVTEAAMRAQTTAKQGMIDSAEKAEADLLPMLNKALGQFDMFVQDVQSQAAAADGRGGAAAAAPKPGTPVPVITGVRSPKTVDNSTRGRTRPTPKKKPTKGGRKVKPGPTRSPKRVRR